MTSVTTLYVIECFFPLEQPLSMDNNGQVGRQLNEEHSDIHDDNSEHKFEGMDRVMGMSLVLGFIFMMLVDQIAEYMSGSNSRNSSTGDAESLVHSSGIKKYF